MVMIHSTCIDCLDVHNPVKLTILRQRRQWAEADAEFLRMLTSADRRDGSSSSFRRPERNSEESSRQKFVRSYKFCRKESAVERTRKWLMIKKQKDKSTAKVVDGGTSSSGKEERRSCSLLEAVFKFLILCVAKVDVECDVVVRSRPAR